MIEVKLSDAINAHAAFTRIGREKLPPKGAYRVGRLIAKLRSEQNDYQDAQLKLLREHGGEEEAGSVTLRPPVKKEGETDEIFAARESVFKEQTSKLSDSLKQVLEEKVKIDYDPIPLAMFETTESDPEGNGKVRVRSVIEPNDMSLVLDFVAE